MGSLLTPQVCKIILLAVGACAGCLFLFLVVMMLSDSRNRQPSDIEDLDKPSQSDSDDPPVSSSDRFTKP